MRIKSYPIHLEKLRGEPFRFLETYAEPQVGDDIVIDGKTYTIDSRTWYEDELVPRLVVYEVEELKPLPA